MPTLGRLRVRVEAQASLGGPALWMREAQRVVGGKNI